jgi:hypothetical protein
MDKNTQMKRYIITTTINEPTVATHKFAEIALRNEWVFVIVGDTKTPHEAYQELEKTYHPYVEYLHPDKQAELYPKLSEIIGWKTIQRRNIGFVYAYNNGAEIVATVDDDNIPYDNWGTDLYVGKEVEVDYYSPEMDVFDPLSVTNYPNLWHRGYPIDYLPYRNRVEYKGKKTVTPLIQADLWDGDPDIDAMCRLTQKPICKFNVTGPFAANKQSPFNSQNTFIHRDALKHYAVWPYVGRMDDIWGGYYTQGMIGSDKLIYNRASVYQDRNVQDLIVNLEKEIIGYRHTLNFTKSSPYVSYSEYIPEQTQTFKKVYFNSFK